MAKEYCCVEMGKLVDAGKIGWMSNTGLMELEGGTLPVPLIQCRSCGAFSPMNDEAKMSLMVEELGLKDV